MHGHIQHLYGDIIELHLDREDYWNFLRARIEAGGVTESQARAYLIHHHDEIEKAKLRPNVLPPPPDEEEYYSQGRPDFEIGTLENELRFGFRLLDRTRHIVLTGTSGSGKTNLMLAFLIRIAAHNQLHPDEAISCVILQRKGIKFVMLAQQLGWRVVGVHHGLRLSLAPLRGMPPHIFNVATCEMFANRSGMIASAPCLMQIMSLIRDHLNDPPGSIIQGPTFQNALEVAEYIPPTLFGGKPEYMAFLRHTLLNLLHASGELWDAHVSLDINHDVICPGQSICIDITNVRPDYLRLFITDLICSQIMLPRLHSGAGNERRVLIVLDEADEDLLPGANAGYTASLPPISLILKQGREFRVGCMLGLSHLGGVSPFVRNNATYQIAFAPADPNTLAETAKALQIATQYGYRMLSTLPIGQCIAVETLGTYPHPMLVTVDPVSLTDNPAQYQQVPYVPGKRLANLPNLKAALDKIIAEHLRTYARQKQAKRLIPPVAHDLLSLATMNPNTPWSILCDKMPKPISAGGRQSAKKALEDAGLAKFVTMRYGKTSKLLIEPTAEGYAYLNRTVPARHGRGGIEHRFAAAEICRAGQAKGYRTAIEHLVPGSSPEHHVDAVWFTPDGTQAFEVAISCFDNLSMHAKACLNSESGIINLTVVVSLKTDISKAQSVLESDPDVLPFMNRIRFETLDSITKES